MLEGIFITDDLKDVYEIRKNVFINEQGVSEEIEMDGLDNLCDHFLLLEDKIPVGTGRILFKNGIYKIGRIAVVKEKRKLGYGDFIVRSLLERVFSKGGDKVYCGSQISAVDFYKSIGFRICSEEYIEANIPHYMMEIRPYEIISKCKK